MWNKNIKEEIDQIQKEIYKTSDEKSFFIRYIEEGWVQYISVVIHMYSMDINIAIWNSEDEEREWIEEKNDYEDFRTFLMRKLNDALCAITELKSVLIENHVQE